MTPPGGHDDKQGGASAHRAQLHVCHEKLGDTGRKWGWCDLPAAAWCFDDDYFVCNLHLIAKHSKHRTQLEDS